MIWYDADTGEPIAPGEAEDGGPPSIDFYYCPSCNMARGIKLEAQAPYCMVCDTCGLILLVR